MPATSRSGECLARRCSRLCAGFALEIDDHEVIAGHQHLAQVIVAVNADLEALRVAARRMASMRARICSRRANTASARSRSAARHVSRLAANRSSALRASSRLAAGKHRCRRASAAAAREGGILGRLRQRAMQLRGACRQNADHASR